MQKKDKDSIIGMAKILPQIGKKKIQGAFQTLTHDSQRRCLTVNVQLRRPGPTLQDFTKHGDPIYELNYRGTKCEIRAKVGDQKCNLA